MGFPPPLPASVVKLPGRPLIGLVLGIFGLFAWTIPFAGLLFAILGLVLSIGALVRPKDGLAIVGTFLNSFSLSMSVVNLMTGLLTAGVLIPESIFVSGMAVTLFVPRFKRWREKQERQRRPAT